MTEIDITSFSDPEWLHENAFTALTEISKLFIVDEGKGREALIRTLEYKTQIGKYQPILASLIQRTGLYPYVSEPGQLSTGDLLNYEFHTVEGLDDIVLHSVQGKIYRALLDGANVILSAPTSFGKSLLIDAMIASRKYKCIVVIVPTIALIDETRRRLSKRFSQEFKIITHPSQKATDKNIYVLTQERFVEFEEMPQPELFVLDEFYKLSPSQGDERTFVLNHAFYRLFKSGSQFFLIGPNVKNISIDEHELNFRYFHTDFSTVATEVKDLSGGDADKNALTICQNVDEPTLIFCKSANSAYKLANYLRNEGVSAANDDVREMATWLRDNYHKDWILADLLDDGFAVHHGALPRSIAYHILRKFNEGAIRFLLCTSTIIEGVNTSAKNIIIYDNKIATKKYDQFTFNNIKGRAGRMFKHFVGHVYVLHSPPQQELPFVDVPAITQPDDAPTSLLIQLDEKDLSDFSKEKLKYLHVQNYIPIEIIKSNSGIEPTQQVKLAEEITNNLQKYHPKLAWTGFPTSDELYSVCELIFDYLMNKQGQDDIFSAKQMHFKILKYSQLKDISKLIEAELQHNQQIDTPTKAVESALKFLRRWCEYNFPRYLSALDAIQKSVFERAGYAPGNYEAYTAMVKNLFMPPSATVLEEYGIPYQVSQKIEQSTELGDDVDQILSNLKKVDVRSLQLSRFEREMLDDTLDNI